MSVRSVFSGRGLALLLAATGGCHSAALPVRLAPTGLTVDGKPVAGDAPSLSGAFRAQANTERRLVIRLEPGADEARLSDVLEHAKSIGVHEATLETERSQQVVHLRSLNHDSRPVLFVSAGSERGGVWLIEPPASNSRALGPWRMGDQAAERRLLELVEEACPRRGCDVSIDASAGSVATTLESWQRVSPRQRDIWLRISPTPSTAVAPPATTLAGRLPPELIQALVRAEFDAFRQCYELGLAKNAALAGTVTVHFIIGLDGRVSSVTDEGSTLPDVAVRECVLRRFEAVAFPAPEGGVVTVVYPIQLAPIDP